MGLFEALLAVGLLTTAYLLLFGGPLKRLWPGSRTVAATNINQVGQEDLKNIMLFLRSRPQTNPTIERREP